MKSKKIVLIGSGSQFTEFYLQEVFKFEEFKGTTIAFVDRRPERLKVVKGIAEKLKTFLDFDINLEGYSDRREALVGADLVFCFAAVNNKEAWANDRVICQRHGLNPYEFHTSSASSLSMGMRHIPLVLDICADMQELCPDAWLVLDNNPLAKILAAVYRHTNTKVFGYCNGHELAQVAIEQILDLDNQSSETINTSVIDREFMTQKNSISIHEMGINHLGWVMTIRDSTTGEDLYPKFRNICKTVPIETIPAGFRFSAEMCNNLGYFPIPGDTHISDYIWCIDDTIAKRCAVEVFDAMAWFGGRDANAWENISARVKDKESAREFVNERRSGWMSVQISRIMFGGKYEYFPAINILNNGCISNLSDDIVVEVPGVLGPDSCRGLNMGELPKEVLAFCQLHGLQGNLIADAAALGDKRLAMQALLMDPFVASITRAGPLLDDIIQSNSVYDIRF